jgi:hypothetical protein
VRRYTEWDYVLWGVVTEIGKGKKTQRNEENYKKDGNRRERGRGN